MVVLHGYTRKWWLVFSFLFFRASVKVKVAEKNLEIVKLRLKNGNKTKKKKKAVLIFFTLPSRKTVPIFVSQISKTLPQGFEAKMFLLSLKPARTLYP